MAPQLAWIGLGNMGRGMAKNLVGKGNLENPLIMFNRTVSKATDLSSKLPSGKSVVAQSIDEAVSKADIIYTSMSNDVAAQENMGKILQNDVKGKLIVETSTVHPDTTNEMAKSVADKGAEMVACPVFGAPAMAESGQLICVFAGPGGCVQKVLKYGKGVMGRANIDFSDQKHGQATLMKLIGNTFIINMVESLAEGHTAAEKTGLGSDNLHQFIEIMFPGPYTAYSTRMTSGDYYKREQPLFAASLARKDAKHALDLAHASGARLKDVEVADAHLAAAEKYMGDKADFAGIYGAVRQESGLKYEN